MFGTAVSVTEIRSGDQIASKSEELIPGELYLIHKTRTINSAGPCGSKTGFIHLDGECYDPRFSSVVIPKK